MHLRLTQATAGGILLAITIATLCPLGDRPRLSTDPQLERFAAFSLFGFTAALAFPKRRALVALGVLTCAFGLEALQRLAPERHGELGDALVKSVGGLIGVLAVDVAQRAQDQL